MSSCLYLFSSVADFSPQLRPQSRTRVTNLRHSQISVTRNFPYALNNLPGNAWKRPLYSVQEAVAPPTLSQNAGWDQISFRRFAISGAFFTMSSEAQLAANRQNSQMSTGPKTEAGKAKSSLNAVKTGLTGRTVLLPSDDAVAYEAHVARFVAEHQPTNEKEQALVESLADTDWRL